LLGNATLNVNLLSIAASSKAVIRDVEGVIKLNLSNIMPKYISLSLNTLLDVDTMVITNELIPFASTTAQLLEFTEQVN
jgi:hypothetical protein